MSDYGPIAARILAAVERMKAQGASERSIALRAGVNPGYFRNLRSGKAKSPVADKLAGLTRALGLDAADVLKVPNEPTAGHRMALWREFRKLEASKVAAALEIDLATLDSYEAGVMPVPVPVLIAFGARYQASFDYLLRDDRRAVGPEFAEWLASRAGRGLPSVGKAQSKGTGRAPRSPPPDRAA